jgi:hypothetical protein
MPDLNLSKLLSKEDEESVSMIINNLLIASRAIRAATEDVNIITRRIREVVTK